MGRPHLGHTEMVALKLHPDLMKFVKAQAEANYQSQAEYIRSLIIEQMRKP